MELKRYGFSDSMILMLNPELVSIIDINDDLFIYFALSKDSEIYYNQIENHTMMMKTIADIVHPEVNHFNEDELNDVLKKNLNMLGHSYSINQEYYTLEESIQRIYSGTIEDLNMITNYDLLTLEIALQPQRLRELSNCSYYQAGIAYNFHKDNHHILSEPWELIVDYIGRNKNDFKSLPYAKNYNNNVEKFLADNNYHPNIKEKDSLFIKYNLRLFDENYFNVITPDDLSYALCYRLRPEWFENHEPESMFGKLMKICSQYPEAEDRIKYTKELYSIDDDFKGDIFNKLLDNFSLNKKLNSVKDIIKLDKASPEEIEEIYKNASNIFVKLKCVSLYPDLSLRYKLSRQEYNVICLESLHSLDDLSGIPSEILTNFLYEDTSLISKINRPLTVDELEVYLSNVSEIDEELIDKIQEVLDKVDEETISNLMEMYPVLSETYKIK